MIVLYILLYMFMGAFTYQFMKKKDIGIRHFNDIDDDNITAVLSSGVWPIFFIIYYSSVIAKYLLKDKEEK